MTLQERTRVLSALDHPNLAFASDFDININHGFYEYAGKGCHYYDVVLTPKTRRIYCFPMVVKVIEELNIELAIYTDINRPGCIIIH